MLLAVIAACEVGFWVLLAAGMAVRYLLRMPRAGAVLLAGVPLVDVVLLVASVIDLQRGGEPSFKHSLAAIFIGVSIGFGHQTIRWADRWAAHLMSGGPRPVKPPKGGPERALRERQGWYRHLLAWSVGVGLMGLGALVAGFDQSQAMLGPAWPWTIALVIDGFVSFSYSTKPPHGTGPIAADTPSGKGPIAADTPHAHGPSATSGRGERPLVAGRGGAGQRR